MESMEDIVATQRMETKRVAVRSTDFHEKVFKFKMKAPASITANAPR